MARPSRYSPELRERAARMVAEHRSEYDSQWAAIVSIAGKIGCSPETLRKCRRLIKRIFAAAEQIWHGASRRQEVAPCPQRIDGRYNHRASFYVRCEILFV